MESRKREREVSDVSEKPTRRRVDNNDGEFVCGGTDTDGYVRSGINTSEEWPTDKSIERTVKLMEKYEDKDAFEKFRFEQRKQRELAALSGVVDEDTSAERPITEIVAIQDPRLFLSQADQIDDVPIEPFNMNEESNEGAFDEFGHFVWSRGDRGKDRDQWLHAVDNGDTMSTFVNPDVQKRIQNSMTDTLDISDDETMHSSRDDVLSHMSTICDLLHEGETPAAALKRIKLKSDITSVTKIRRPKPNPDMDSTATNNDRIDVEGRILRTCVNPTEEVKPLENKERHILVKEKRMAGQSLKDFEAITTSCDILVSCGYNLYFDPRETIWEKLCNLKLNEIGTHGRHVSQEDDTWWQFRWLSNQYISDEQQPQQLQQQQPQQQQHQQLQQPQQQPQQQQFESMPSPDIKSSDEIITAVHTNTTPYYDLNNAFGPYSIEQMAGWILSGYFSNETPVDVRQVTQDNEPLDGVWHRFDEIDFNTVPTGNIEEAVDEED